MQGPGIAALEKERGPGSFRMAQPPFISDIPSAGMALPQVRPLTWTPCIPLSVRRQGQAGRLLPNCT